MNNNNQNKDKMMKFLEVILVLKELYINFDFDVRDANGNFTRRFNMWYQVLSHLDTETLEYVILDYAKTSIYPPQSPAHILEHYKKLHLSLLPNENEAFDEALKLWRSNKYKFQSTINMLESTNKAQAKAFELIESNLYQGNRLGVTQSTENIEKWARIEFVKIYKEEVEKDVNFKVKNGGKLFEIGTNNNLKLLN